MFYGWRYNRALIALGYDPLHMPMHHREAGLTRGLSGGDTPQEAALVSFAFANRRRRSETTILKTWILNGRIDLNKLHVHRALSQLNGGQLP